MWKRRRPIGAAAVAIALAAAGCGGGRSPGPAPEGEPVPGGTAVIAFPADPDVLNSLIHASSFSGQILSLLQVGLLEMAEDQTWIPAIARDWLFGPDSLSVTFRLRPWRWSDGAPLGARDVAATYRLFIDPAVGSPRAGGLEAIAGVAVVDEATVRYDFKRRLADPLFPTAHAILPAHRLAELDPAVVRSWPLNERPLASGPFQLASWTRNRELVLVRNPHYPGEPARLDRLVFRIIPDETARLVELETGGVDFMEELPAPAAARMEAGGQVVVHRLSGRYIGQVQWNLRDPRFADRRVRRALSLAIDRQGIVDRLLLGYGRVASSPIPPALWAHAVAPPPEPYAPDAARTLLEEAGWRDGDGDGVRERDGLRLAFTLVTRRGDPVRENAAVIIRENLRAVGVAVQIRALELSAAVDEVRRGRFDAYLGLFQARMAVDPSALLHSSAGDRFNYGGYKSAEVDSLLRLGLSLADRARALPVWRRLQEVVAADSPIAFLYYPDILVGASRRLRAVRPHVLSPYQNVTEWWIAPGDRRGAFPDSSSP